MRKLTGEKMLTDLDHLPETTQSELETILAILFSEFADALSLSTQNWKKEGRILKVILFGAHARKEGGAALPGGRLPKYSILVLVSDDRLADKSKFSLHAEDRLLREHSVTRSLTVPVSLSVRGVKSFHSDLQRGTSFVRKAVEEGKMLYELPGHDFTIPLVRDRDVAQQERVRHFDYWFTSASEFLELARIARDRKWLNRAIFQYHQATEALYHTVLFVITHDSPRSHNIPWLRDRCEDIFPSLAEVWPGGSKFEERCFRKLQSAYVKSRYDQAFRIKEDELAWIAERVELLHSKVREIAQRKIRKGESACLK